MPIKLEYQCYRLGAFGFLSTEDSEVSGNNGLRDQVVALKWVQKNIEHFGGDPDSVTIFGQSSGAWSVSHHVLSPQSKGLFKRAIIQSGPPISFGCGALDSATARRSYQKLASLLGCENDSLKCLESKPVESIAKHVIVPLHVPWGLPFTWLPVIEDTSYEPFLSLHPLEILESGNFDTNVEVIIGTNSDEGVANVEIALNHPILWFLYAFDWDHKGTMALFNIAENVTDNDIDKAERAVDHYVGSKWHINQG